MVYLLRDGWYRNTKINHRFIHGFGTKHSITAQKRDKLEELAAYLHVPDHSVLRMEQVHGTSIVSIQEKTKSTLIKGVDGIVTNQPHCILTVRTADCVPIIYIDAENNIIGISHQGWQGTLSGMAPNMIKKMEELGAENHTIQILIGPAICGNHYPVFGERLHRFEMQYAKWKNLIIKKHADSLYLDIPLLNVLQLLEIGISHNHITVWNQCTYEREDLFFSYRRDGTIEHGGMVSYVCLLNA